MTNLLTFRGLDFQPVFGAAAGSVSAIGTLRHDPLKAIALCFLEELPARCLAVTAERYQPVVRQDILEPLFAIEQRQTAQILTIQKHEVEGAVKQLRFVAERILQQLKMRDAVRIEYHKLAVYYGIAF